VVFIGVTLVHVFIFREVFGTHWILFDEFVHLFPGEKVTEHDVRF